MSPLDWLQLQDTFQDLVTLLYPLWEYGRVFFLF